MSIDPITLSVIQAGLQQVCDEMDLTFSRAAFSPVIAEANDRSDGIYAADDGSLIAQGAQHLHHYRPGKLRPRKTSRTRDAHPSHSATSPQKKSRPRTNRDRLLNSFG